MDTGLGTLNPDTDTHNLHRSGYNLAAIVAGFPDNATNPQQR